MKSQLKRYAMLAAATVLGLAIGLATASAETYRIGLAVPVTGTGADAGKREARLRAGATLRTNRFLTC